MMLGHQLATWQDEETRDDLTSYRAIDLISPNRTILDVQSRRDRTFPIYCLHDKKMQNCQTLRHAVYPSVLSADITCLWVLKSNSYTCSYFFFFTGE